MTSPPSMLVLAADVRRELTKRVVIELLNVRVPEFEILNLKSLVSFHSQPADSCWYIVSLCNDDEDVALGLQSTPGDGVIVGRFHLSGIGGHLSNIDSNLRKQHEMGRTLAYHALRQLAIRQLSDLKVRIS